MELLGTCPLLKTTHEEQALTFLLPPTEDDSPYPEVRSAVANTDDPDMPCGTFRAWFIGMIWAVLIPGLNQFFFFRFPAVTISGASITSSRNSCG